MSKVFNMVGGGGKNISSIIITGLESTDTVTCTKDGKSYTAAWDSTAQHWEIVGLPLGTFTVTATRGTNTNTETVLIDITGVYEIEMSFKLWLYRDGDECESVTGGWTTTGYTSGNIVDSGSLSDSTLSFSGNSGRITFLGTNNLVDFSKYNTIKAEVTLRSGSFTYDPEFTLLNTKEGFSGSDACIKNVKITDIGIFSIDISDISVSGYVGFYLYGTGTYEVSKVWLE